MNTYPSRMRSLSRVGGGTEYTLPEAGTAWWPSW